MITGEGRVGLAWRKYGPRARSDHAAVAGERGTTGGRHSPETLEVNSDAQVLLDAMDEIPVLPAVAARVLSFSDETVSLQEVSHVLSADPVLTAALLKVANSAYYGFSRRIATVREAVLLLGFKQVRQVALGASMMNTFKKCKGRRTGSTSTCSGGTRWRSR